MPTVDERVTLTVSLPKSVADRVNDAAKLASRPVDEEIAWLIEGGLDAETDVESMLATAREAYRARYERMGKRPPTSKELQRQMERIREEVANELYPD